MSTNSLTKQTNKTISLTKPPAFTLEILKLATNYTDKKFNVVFETYRADSLLGQILGAKGSGKSFNWAIVTIYRLVNEKIFCSCWARNQYSHIVNTLKPTFEKALDFLAIKFGLDYRPYLKIYTSGIYWDYDDGGLGRAIFFMNFESIQSFQGFTLKSFDFRFGELVIDEPLEDVEKSNKSPKELQELYELQKEKIPFLLQATIFRDKASTDFKLKFMALYNLFDLKHFFVQDYLNKLINVETIDEKLNKDNLNLLIENSFLYKEDKEFDDGLGMTAGILSKFYVPKSEISDMQLKMYQILKKTNYRLWMITVAGFGFNEEKKNINYFLTPYVFDDEGNFSENIHLISNDEFIEAFKASQIEVIVDGFDPGKFDNSSWIRIALTKDGEIVVLDGVEDIKIFLKRKNIKISNPKIRTLINKTLLEIIKTKNDELETILKEEYISVDWFQDQTSFLMLDNDIVVEMLNQELENSKIRTTAWPAIRRDTNQHRFSIKSRQEFWKQIFIKQKIFFANGTEKFLKEIVKQFIPNGKSQRDEDFNPEIYDVINAFEYAFSAIYKYVLGRV